MNKLNLNENQFKADGEIEFHLIDAIHNSNFYLESKIETEKLKEKLSKKFHINNDNVMLSNGIDEILLFIAASTYKLKGKFGVTEYTYNGFDNAIEYIRGALGTDASEKIVRLPLKNMATDLDVILDEVRDKDISLIYLCNPHNPIGNIMVGNLERFLQYTNDRNTIVLFDEAYAEYGGDTFRSMIDYVQEYRNIAVTRTFSKAYGMAGLRCAYLITYNDYLTTQMEQFHNAVPYSINRVAYTMACDLIDNESYLDNIIKCTNEARNYLTYELSCLGITVYPSITNFVLAEYGKDADGLVEYLEDNHILIRNAKNFGLQGHVRITVGRLGQMKEMIAKIKEFECKKRRQAMNKEKLKGELKEIVMGMSKSKQEVVGETNMIYDLGFDSVAMIELFTEVEERYGIEFSFEDVDFEDIAVFQNFVNYVAGIIG